MPTTTEPKPRLEKQIIAFDWAVAKKVYDETQKGKRVGADPLPTYGQRFQERFIKDGRKVPEDGFPDEDIIDPDKLEPGFWLVKDRGVYLMTNMDIYSPGEKATVAYAEDLSPEDDGWYERSRKVIGGDDCTFFVPESAYEYQRQQGRDQFTADTLIRHTPRPEGEHDSYRLVEIYSAGMLPQ